MYIIEKRFILKQYNIILHCRLGFSTRARLYTVLWTLDSRKPPSSYPKRGPRNVIDVVFSERHRRWHFHSARVRDGRPRRLRAFYVRVNWFTKKRDRSDCLLMYDYYYRLGIFLRFVYESSCVSRPEYRMTSERNVGNFFFFSVYILTNQSIRHRVFVQKMASRITVGSSEIIFILFKRTSVSPNV